MHPEVNPDSEARRLQEDAQRTNNWKRWGPYLSERQWGTVREDYSPDGSAWKYFPHDHARSRAYRWGEDGLLGITDRECRLCFALALWNERDSILKERLFGLAHTEGNHGEDVKECYYYLDATPTSSYVKGLYRYPQAAFPYAELVAENGRRSRDEPEFELPDTGVFDHNRYFDVFAEYAKDDPDDLLIRITVANRAPESAVIHVLPTLWFRNTWSWGRDHEGSSSKPRLRLDKGAVAAEHETLGTFWLAADRDPAWMFTENETDTQRLFGMDNRTPYVKNAFNEFLVHGQTAAVNPEKVGTKAAAHYRLEIPANGETTIRLRLANRAPAARGHFGRPFDATLEKRRSEADAFYAARISEELANDERCVVRQAWAGLLWNKQFYHYVVRDWLDGDPTQPPPPPGRRLGRNSDWPHLYNRDVISMPDKWEYPWYAAWDLAFHMIALAPIDPEFAKQQLVLMLREWYMHPNGQLPAYEFALGDVNPPVHAWACWRVFKIASADGQRDRVFLSRCFQKLIINFTWWVNRKDIAGRHLFAGGFLGLDNIGVFNRSEPLPVGGQLEQADGTAWMAFYCTTMLAIALALAADDPATEDMASKFFEHFVAIADALNNLGGTGLWDETDGFYYDQVYLQGTRVPLKVRSLVGLVPLLAVEVLEDAQIRRLPGFQKRLTWFLENRQDLSRHISYCAKKGEDGHGRRLLAIPSQERLVRVLRYVLDANEFLSPFGIRSLSKYHAEHPYVLRVDGVEYRVAYEPAESRDNLFGGNSNWRGPIWLPLNYLLIEALERYHHFYGDSLRVECPTGSGQLMNLQEVANEITTRVAQLFKVNAEGERPCAGAERKFAGDPHSKDLVLFYEYFDGETGRGLGACHQTGWTALVGRLIADRARFQNPAPAPPSA